ncbi:type 1 glutamine amidotransferase [Methylotenera sp.]|uniref:type 1 glutamine amidotransferase n=1 Tax=Methylotenera sp. TaxID=2051956 RepID=UPI0027346269|nr:type 1 glutamine amidotransferase [Methylotenera sp.]MDP3778344.1 type 1 glutamine amidotransferase [Methylotenera sp.]
MKPVIIFRHFSSEGPGYLAEFLDEQQIPWCLIKIDEGDALPTSIDAYSGLVLMGGPMSVNDDLPWIVPVLDLIRQAVDLNVPVLGHCLGAQLMSKALGAEVTKNAVKEIGWGEVKVSGNSAAQYWFGELESFNAFHWHGETFSLPSSAMHLLASPFCENQAYAIGQKHLALQCHIEMTADMVNEWCVVGADEIASALDSPAVQRPDVIQQTLPLHCFFLNKVANQVYQQWIKGLAN